MKTKLLAIVVASVSLVPVSAQFQAARPKVVFADTFSSKKMDSKKWLIPTWYSPYDGTYVGRTQFRTSQNSGLPLIKSGYARIELETYNPTGFSMYGTDLISKRSFKTTSKGVLFTYVVRMQQKFPKGAVAGLFLYSLKEGSDTLHDEIDFELLGNDPKKVHTNIYGNEPLGVGRPTSHRFKSGSATTSHTYQILWATDSVSWYVDGTLVRTITSAEAPIPTGPMFLHVNYWAPDAGWTEAYSSGLAPTDSNQKNREYFILLDSIKVEAL